MKFTAVEHQKPQITIRPWIAILGNPNCGKTALFNRLTGLHHKVGNYPGITVEKKHGPLRGTPFELHDMPGIYSLSAKSLDERVVTDSIHSWSAENRPRAVLVVLDATNLSRSLFLALEILEYGLPTLIVLNMIDQARKQNIIIDTQKLRNALGAYAVIEASAKTGEGVEKIIQSIQTIELTDVAPPKQVLLKLSPETEKDLAPLKHFVQQFDMHRKHPTVEALEYLQSDPIEFESGLSLQENVHFAELVENTRAELVRNSQNPKTLKTTARYALIDELLDQVRPTPEDQPSMSERMDSVLTHPVWGSLSLILVLGFIFNAIFTWAQLPMGWIESGIAWLGTTMHELLPAGQINSLVTDGIIPGVGNVIVFLPQIVLLIFFLGLFEDSGYMSRMAFMMDRGLRRFGLQGKAVLPLLSGFACAIPAVMAARTIENSRDRLITIMLIPLMSCSARLPVYTLLIAAFVPQQTILGFLQLQSLVLFGAYFLGLFTAIFASYVIKKLAGRKHRSFFIMELPPYRWPLMRSVFYKVYDGAKLFLINAGSIILAISIVLWFLASYPTHNDTSMTAKERIQNSYAGQIGHAMEPVIKPLGFDWKIGVGLLTSFAAREVIVSAFATLYNVEAEEEGNISLITALKTDKQPDGSPTYSPIVGISLLVFFVFAAQCMSTMAIVKRETNSWRWPLVMLLYMNVLAYGAAFLVYQLGTLGAG